MGSGARNIHLPAGRRRWRFGTFGRTFVTIRHRHTRNEEEPLKVSRLRYAWRRFSHTRPARLWNELSVWWWHRCHVVGGHRRLDQRLACLTAPPPLDGACARQSAVGLAEEVGSGRQERRGDSVEATGCRRQLPPSNGGTRVHNGEGRGGWPEDLDRAGMSRTRGAPYGPASRELGPGAMTTDIGLGVTAQTSPGGGQGRAPGCAASR
ncbi:hypothetical protein GCM10012275_41460 [Longimycelium tulufanense]|uniref:Uncharacterized protein n=1 Tax=Longimycelium tulufanense TaxID=907463 RepID=A0A8J3CHA5_9PSEU|nr:hypothetical protein GCM10012275_41460 [Longimycelium tulufanense]